MYSLQKSQKDGTVKVFGYEVHKVRKKASDTTKYRNPDGSYNVIQRPDREILASDQDFGIYGWSFSTKEAAEHCFNKQCKEAIK